MALIAGMSVGCLSLPLSICDFQLSFPKVKFTYFVFTSGLCLWSVGLLASTMSVRQRLWCSLRHQHLLAICRSDLLVLGQIISDSWIVTSCSRRVSSVQGCVSLWSELPKDFSGKISSLQLHLGKRQY